MAQSQYVSWFSSMFELWIDFSDANFNAMVFNENIITACNKGGNKSVWTII